MIGVFDSGYGGLFILRALTEALPTYDFCYFGDNARAPYGPRSAEEIYAFTKEGIAFLEQQGCALIILACNTASAVVLRRLQQERQFDQPRVLGVLVPSLESIIAVHPQRVAVVGTEATVKSGAFVRELAKMDPLIQVEQHACAHVAGMIERGESETEIEQVIRVCMAKFRQPYEALVLGCTHYGHVTEIFKKYAQPGVAILHQSEAVATKTLEYLAHHLEIDRKLGKQGRRLFYSSAKPQDVQLGFSRFFGEDVPVLSCV